MKLATATQQRDRDFLPIPIHSLMPNRCMAVDLYIRDLNTGALRLYRSREIPFEEADRDKLTKRGVRSLYILESAHRDFQDQLRENLLTILEDEGQTVTSRFACLSEVVRDTMSTTFRKGNMDNCVRECENMADHCVSLLQRDDYMVSELLGVLHHDFYTFTHSTNVAMMCGMLGRALGISDSDELQRLTVGGLLHDVGKQEVADHILSKPARLTDEEFDIVKNHARWGYRKLCRREDLSFAQLMMVYQHHERMAGGGYPVGCPGDEIHDWARICTVVDVHEALSSHRPYRRPMSPKELEETMTNSSGKIFDPEILRCWRELLCRM